MAVLGQVSFLGDGGLLHLLESHPLGSGLRLFGWLLQSPLLVSCPNTWLEHPRDRDALPDLAQPRESAAMAAKCRKRKCAVPHDASIPRSEPDTTEHM